jgi:hypothetical protein
MTYEQAVEKLNSSSTPFTKGRNFPPWGRRFEIRVDDYN